MSPALLVAGGPFQNPNPNEQEHSKVQSFSFNGMNPSSFGDLNSGFSNSSGNDQNLGFNSPPMPRSKHISRQRMVKVRKQLSSLNLKSPADIAGPGFNPFAPVSNHSDFRFGKDGIAAFSFGTTRSNSGNVESEVIEQMKNVRIGSGNESFNNNLNATDRGDFVFGSDQNKSFSIDVNMELTIDDDETNKVDENSKSMENDIASFGLRGNVPNSFGKSVESSLPDDLRKKLNLKETEDFNVGHGVSSIGDVNNFGSKNLNIKGSVDINDIDNKTYEKNRFSFGKMEGTRSYVGGEGENVLSREMENKLNIGNAMAESSVQTDIKFSSPLVFGKGMQTENGSNKKFQDLSGTVPTEFGFRGGIQGKEASGSQIPMDKSSGFAGRTTAFSSGGYSFGLPPMGRAEKRDGFIFTSKQDAPASPFVEFKTPNVKGNIFTGLNQKVEISAKFKDSKVKKKKGKLKQPTTVHLCSGQDFVLGENCSREIPESYESYSPMDVSPYQETLSDTQFSRETSVASEESLSLDNQCPSTDSKLTSLDDAIDEELAVATQQMDINEEEVKFREMKEGSDYFSDRSVGAENPPEDSVSGADTESFKSANEEIDFVNDVLVTSAENEASSSTNAERQDNDFSVQFGSPRSSEDMAGSGFTFSASSAAQAALKHHHKMKNWAKVGRSSFNESLSVKVTPASSLQFAPPSGSSLPSSPSRGKKVGPFTPLHMIGDNMEALRGQEMKQDSDMISAASIAAQEACEKWRLRGNQAYTRGDLSKAEDCYSQGINCISRNETSRSSLRALMLCYSNRAATRMSQGRMKDALEDCKMAAEIDPNFLKVQVRAANCYLALGEIEDASVYFKKCLQLGSDVCVDRKIAVEASDGLQKAQKVSECLLRSSELLQRKSYNDAESALELIVEALVISPYSEKLIELKATSLFLLRKYEEVIQLCDQTFNSAEKGSQFFGTEFMNSSFGLWRCQLIFKSYFYLGRLEDAISSLEKQDQLIARGNDSKTMESQIPLAAIVRELLRHKAAGNEAFQGGKHSEAIEHYTAALSCNVESRPFAAICFCNRAAAYKSLGQITDAIADCSLAIALDGNYLKAISRRVALYEMIRDYSQAANDLQRVVVLLTKQIEEKNNSSDKSGNLANDLRLARMRLSTIEEDARKDIPLNMYLILGIEPSASASEIKKAYRKAALRHHPDKAVQSLARSENVDDGLWKEIGEEIHKHADRLFKMIGEAYAVLSDTTKRAQYDLDEEMRNSQKKHNVSGGYRTYTDTHSYPYERSGGPRRQWRDVWRSYGGR